MDTSNTNTQKGNAMNVDKIVNQARAMACMAKPGILKQDGKIYTLVFDQTEWIYKVYEDGFWLVNFNCKSLTKAKTMLKEWLAN